MVNCGDALLNHGSESRLKGEGDVSLGFSCCGKRVVRGYEISVDLGHSPRMQKISYRSLSLYCSIPQGPKSFVFGTGLREAPSIKNVHVRV